jgi:pyridoxal 5'-phosphate synthase pdxT subunit
LKTVGSTVGILALQGDFDAHRKAIEQASTDAQIPAQTREVRTASDLAQCDALIIPGGESSTMWKLLEMEQLIDPLRSFASQKPIYGSCAGAILLARVVTHPAQASLGLMDIAVERNAYGRQVDSRIAKVTMPEGELEAVFIRAPIIRRTGPDVQVLASYEGDPIWVEQGRHMVTTFHPELTANTLVHRRLLQKL